MNFVSQRFHGITARAQTNKNVDKKHILGGMIARKERWGLTRRGRLVAGLVIVAAGFLCLLGIHPFLAVTRRVDARVLVVEGWVNPYAIGAAVKEFEAGHYERFIRRAARWPAMAVTSMITTLRPVSARNDW